jgi:hypothetical protein
VTANSKNDPYSPCPCGSGDKAKFCCKTAKGWLKQSAGWRTVAWENITTMFAFMAVETNIPWPEVEVTIDFHGHSMRLRPGTETRRADIAVEYGPGESLEDAVCVFVAI